MRGGAVEARRAHNPKVVGSNPTPATNPVSVGLLRYPYLPAGFCDGGPLV